MEQLIWDFAIYISLFGFILFVLALLTGLRILKIKYLFKVHKKFALASFITIGIHAIIMIYFYFFS